MGSPEETLERRLRRVEDRIEIDELIARYCLVMDNRDVDGIPDLFTQDVVVRSGDGVINATGHDTVVSMFRGRFEVLGPSNHFTHDRIVTFDENDADRAQGLVLAHAEMNRKGAAMIAAIRYLDKYRRETGRWRIAERVLTFMYYVKASEYLDALGAGLKLRNRAYQEPQAADWPESLSTWKDYYG